MKVCFSVCLASLILALSPLQGEAQSSLSGLNQQLQQAVNRQNWSEAIQVIDQILRIAPEQSSQLQPYRTQLQGLQRSNYRGTSQPSASPPSQSQAVARQAGYVPIKRRDNGIAIIDVTFNRRKSFEMLVDSGASLTVITRPMASALGITPAHVVRTVGFSTANGYTEMPIVFIKSLEVGGLSSSQIPVAVAGPDMDIGLLGQDFLQKYDVSFRRDRLEFHRPQ